jgi:uncharacterized protein YprB with RNaseH-like and TPR domain
VDIETDTSVDGLDPSCSPIVAVAVEGEGVEAVLTGHEGRLLADLDDLIRSLRPGVLVTWNGARFDLPFIADRCRHHRVDVGLRLLVSEEPCTHPLPGHESAYLAAWYDHGHLDGYKLFRSDAGRALPVSCGLKNLARLVGLEPFEVDRTAIHDLSADDLHRYVLSDARLARQMVERRIATALAAVDVLPRPDGPDGTGQT